MQVRAWKPGLCSECHRPPGKQGLRRGLCLACYQYRRRRRMAMPPKAASARQPILHRKVKGAREGLVRNPWDRFR
jgi:hypothetical protein